MPDMITLYRGKRITELSRDELISALELAVAEIKRLQSIPKDYMAMLKEPFHVL